MHKKNQLSVVILTQYSVSALLVPKTSLCHLMKITRRTTKDLMLICMGRTVSWSKAYRRHKISQTLLFLSKVFLIKSRRW
jgi:hypothetical protein